MPPAVLGRQVKWVRERAEVRQVRQETWGPEEWLRQEAAMAAAAPRSLLISAIGRDSAASLKGQNSKTLQRFVSCQQCELPPTVCLLTGSRRHRWASVAAGLEALLPLLEHLPWIEGPLGNQRFGLLGTSYVDGDFTSETNTQKVREVPQVKRESSLSSWRSAGSNCTKSVEERQVHGMLFALIRRQIPGQD